MARSKSYSDQKNWSNTYLTPPSIIQALGPFDTDPCCPPVMPWRTARFMFSHERPHPSSKALVTHHDGLTQPWRGRVFMNPPYRGVIPWAKRFAEHGNGICLLNGRSSETRATQIIMAASSAIWFPNKRFDFHNIKGKPLGFKWFPSLLIGMTERDAVKLEKAAAILGGVVYRHRARRAG